MLYFVIIVIVLLLTALVGACHYISKTLCRVSEVIRKIEEHVDRITKEVNDDGRDEE